MTRTLLYTVQRVLEKLDLDNVNSVNDSQDAILVAREAETTFYDMVSRNDWPEREDLIEIESAADPDLPTTLRLPDNVIELKSLRYDVTPYGEDTRDIRELCKLSVEEFLKRSEQLVSDDVNVQTVNRNGIELKVLNNKAPEYYTSFDNENLFLDSYDSVTETTVQGNKTAAVVITVPTFEIDDEYVIPLDAVTYPLYLSELTSAMSTYLNGIQSPEDERRRARGISRLRRKALRTVAEDSSNNYGRKGNGRS